MLNDNGPAPTLSTAISARKWLIHNPTGEDFGIVSAPTAAHAFVALLVDGGVPQEHASVVLLDGQHVAKLSSAAASMVGDMNRWKVEPYDGEELPQLVVGVEI